MHRYERDGSKRTLVLIVLRQASEVCGGELKKRWKKEDVLYLLSCLFVYSDSYTQIASANKLQPS